jgi:hypothetical protein
VEHHLGATVQVPEAIRAHVEGRHPADLAQTAALDMETIHRVWVKAQRWPRTRRSDAFLLVCHA